MPHVLIKHFPAALTPEQKAELAHRITSALQSAFQCDPGAVSIALEPISPARWTSAVYWPDIVAQAHLLCKTPAY